MNDGGYRKYEESIGRNYERPMRTIVERAKKAGVTVVVGSPGVVDTYTFRRGQEGVAETYNENLAQLGKIAQKVAADNGMVFADVHGAMMDAMTKAKAKYGQECPVAGGDGVHPGDNGQLVMAYAFLKAMGLDGNVGTITVDLKGGATATDGHKVLSAEKGVVEVESSRYPFCFPGDPKRKDSYAGILPFVPFNQDLNRFELVVKNLPGGKAKVQWGKQTKEFSADELAKGVNLAAEFLDNPFRPAFQKVWNEVGNKENFETRMIKGLITNFRSFGGKGDEYKEVRETMAALGKQLMTIQEKLDAQARAAVVPVKHTIKIIAE